MGFLETWSAGTSTSSKFCTAHRLHLSAAFQALLCQFGLTQRQPQRALQCQAMICKSTALRGLEWLAVDGTACSFLFCSAGQLHHAMHSAFSCSLLSPLCQGGAGDDACKNGCSMTRHHATLSKTQCNLITILLQVWELLASTWRPRAPTA